MRSRLLCSGGMVSDPKNINGLIALCLTIFLRRNKIPGFKQPDKRAWALKAYHTNYFVNRVVGASEQHTGALQAQLC